MNFKPFCFSGGEKHMHSRIRKCERRYSLVWYILIPSTNERLASESISQVKTFEDGQLKNIIQESKGKDWRVSPLKPLTMIKINVLV